MKVGAKMALMSKRDIWIIFRYVFPNGVEIDFSLGMKWVPIH